MKQTYRRGSSVSSAVILVLAAWLVFSPGLAKAQKALRLNLGIIPITEMLTLYVATEKGIKERPEVMKKFVAAMSRAIDYVNAHRQEWPAILARNMRIDPAVIEKLEEGHRFDPKVDMDHLRWYLDLMAKRGLLRKSVDPGTLISPLGS